MNIRGIKKGFFILTVLIAFVLIENESAKGQTTIFTETMGTTCGSAGVAISTYTGFSNSGTLTYTGTGDVRDTSASTGYTGASGSCNTFLTNSSGTNFQISSINTTGYSSLTLSFGIRKNLIASDGSDLLVEVSSDGISYTALTFTALPTGTGTVGWYLRTATGIIPATANLRIRFTNNGSVTQYRIDDVTLAGVGPSAASATVGGRVTEANGRGIFRARVTLIDSQGIEQTAYTNTQGYYSFPDVPGGQTYIFSVRHLRYQFAVSSFVEFIDEDNPNINFVSIGESLRPANRLSDQ